MSLMSFADGCACSFWSSSVLPDPGFAGEDFHFRIMGDEGLIDLDPYRKLRIVREGAWETVFEQPQIRHDESNAAYGITRMAAYCDQMQGFVNSIRGEPGGEGNAQDGRAGVAAVIAMLDSARDSKVVKL